MANNIFPPVETAYPISDAHVDGLEAYQAQYAESTKDPEAFWATVAERLTWYQKWDTVRDYDFVNGDIKWFEGGTLNACYNCLDRHVEAGHGDATAIIWEGNDPSEDKTFTFSELLSEVKKFANVLESTRHRKRRSRLYLSTDGARIGDCNAGVCENRCCPFHRLRCVFSGISPRSGLMTRRVKC